MSCRIDKHAFARMWAQGVPAADIATRFAVTLPAVSQAARRMGLPKRTPGGHRRVCIGAVAALDTFMGSSAISVSMCCSRDSVWRAQRRLRSGGLV